MSLWQPCHPLAVSSLAPRHGSVDRSLRGLEVVCVATSPQSIQQGITVVAGFLVRKVLRRLEQVPRAGIMITSIDL